MVHRNNLLSSWRWEDGALHNTRLVLDVDRIVFAQRQAHGHLRGISGSWVEIGRLKLSQGDLRAQIMFSNKMHSANQHSIFHTDCHLLRPVEKLAECQCIRQLELVYHLESVKRPHLHCAISRGCHEHGIVPLGDPFNPGVNTDGAHLLDVCVVKTVNEQTFFRVLPNLKLPLERTGNEVLERHHYHMHISQVILHARDVLELIDQVPCFKRVKGKPRLTPRDYELILCVDLQTLGPIHHLLNRSFVLQRDPDRLALWINLGCMLWVILGLVAEIEDKDTIYASGYEF